MSRKQREFQQQVQQLEARQHQLQQQIQQFQAHQQRFRQEAMERFDRDGNGRLSKQERTAAKTRQKKTHKPQHPRENVE